MNGNNIFIDTNIILYLLNGDDTLAEIINRKQVFISFISEIELLSYKEITPKERLAVKKFIDDCTIIDINEKIKELSIDCRINNSIKLPDAIIASTATYINAPLLSADKNFKKIKNLSLILYEPS
jgi:predicted nucleic acid-binding protein